MKILLIEDDDVFIKVLTRTLKAHRYIIDTVKDGEMGWTYGSTFEYDLMVMDVVLPKLDGISLCKRFRAEGYVTPILLLTAQDTNTVKVQGLDAGADDYVVKPFDQAELIARIRALLRRGSTNPLPLLTWGDLMLNPSTCEVSYKGQHLALTTKEYELLELMMRDGQHVFSTEEILDHLWSSEEFPSEATVRSHIRRVRRKLVTKGAPQDFIATLHGRGYYLKSSDTATPSMWKSPANALALKADPTMALSTSVEQRIAEGDRILDTQQQYLAFLNETWTTTKPKSIDQIAVLLNAVSALQTDQLTPEQQTQAQQLAHKLAGTLSIFGLNKAVHLTRQLEYWLGSQEPLHPNHAPLMNSLVTALQDVIQDTTLIQLSQIPDEQSPRLLLVSADAEFNQSLETIAVNRGIRIEIVPSLDLDSTLTGLAIASDAGEQRPDVIVVRLPSDRSQPHLKGAEWSTAQTALLVQTLRACTSRYPSLPIVVIGDQLELSDRLEMIRHGGTLFLDTSTAIEQVIAAAVNLLKGSKLPTKVMIVDDDHNWLRTLPTLLKPWGFKVTTLADPQQFWTVLQAVVPDVLVLDVNMPEINGFELCQILRSDPHWQRLPVLFLSALTDSISQQHAFTVGADDYLCKPLMGSELANRILSRLQRVRAWAS
jgi:DNA-binding response OmpR family regulator/HPt (histidine-containing phosphotransfer) domain-containing protein